MKKTWARSWEVALGLALCLMAPVWTAPARYVTASDAALWFGSIVLGSGLLRDLWALWITRPQAGEKEAAMCVESMVGVAAIVGGLAVLFIPAGQGAMCTAATLSAGLGLCFIFAGWVHDLVVLRRGGRLQWLRAPDHGSFVVHLLRGRAKECLTGVQQPDTEGSTSEAADRTRV